MKRNFILNTDSYKQSHFRQDPPGTTHKSAYLESRGGRFEESVLFGTLPFVQDTMMRRVTKEDVDHAETVLRLHGVPFNRDGWDRVVNVHGGYLPVEISAVPEGMVVPVRNVLTQVINTDPELPWAAGHTETSMLRSIWYPTTVATLSREIKRIIKNGMVQTCDTLDKLPVMLNDFGSRGVSSYESSELGGAAHLVNFIGTDNLPAVDFILQTYASGLPEDYMPGVSIPAAEHSTITAWGRDGEADAYENMLDQFVPEGGMVAVVSDSYDLFNAVDNIWGGTLQAKVIEYGQKGSVLVVRPDSGDPVDVVLATVNKLMDAYGYKTNTKGFRVLPDYIRVIQGDGITIDSIREIVIAMTVQGLSLDNICFGMGGGLLQQVDRDTMEFAVKCSAIKVNGEWQDVYKQPATDPNKNSKRGVLALVQGDDSKRRISTIRRSNLGGRIDLLTPIYRNGKCLIDSNFEDIRALAEV